MITVAARVARTDFLSLQVYYYEHAFGRWASTALITLAAYAGTALVAVLPAVAFALWLAALTWLGYEPRVLRLVGHRGA